MISAELLKEVGPTSNVYELANRCKVWAEDQGEYGYIITSTTNYAEVDFDCYEATTFKVAIEGDEPKCIFQVAQWIYDKENR